MYLNIPLYKSKNLKPEDIYYLCAIKQIDKEVLETIPNDVLERFKSFPLVEYIKGKKNEEDWCKIRLNKAGKQLLNDLEEAPVESEDKTVFEWLKNYYLKAGKEIGNGAKTQRHIRDFRLKSGIQKNNLITLVLDFLAENEERSRKLEYIWYYPKTAFATRFDLEESWLWNHFIKNKERLESKFEKYE